MSTQTNECPWCGESVSDLIRDDADPLETLTRQKCFWCREVLEEKEKMGLGAPMPGGVRNAK